MRKYKFDIEKIEFLNFIIFIKKIRINSKRIPIIKEWFKFKTYCEVQILLRFVNFYKHFIYYCFKMTESLTSLFKNNENEKKKSLFKWWNGIEQTFCQLKNIFMSISFFTHYNLLKSNWVKIDILNFIIASILN